MQSKIEVIQNVERANGAQASLRTWTKPEAKIAEVAQVTLAGGLAFTTNDLQVCSS